MSLKDAAESLHAEIGDNPNVQSVGVTDDSIVVYMKRADPRLRKKYRNGFENFQVAFKQIGNVKPL